MVRNSILESPQNLIESGRRALSRGWTWPDLDTPQEGSVEAELKVRLAEDW